MSFHSTDITLDNTFNLDQLQSMDESARDAKHLFPDLGTMDDDDFFNLKQEGDTAGELNEPMSSENLNSHLAKRAIGSDLRDTSNIVATSIIVPPVIRSNPETPNELNFSFQDIAPPMNRVGSEQSSLHGLKPQNTKLQHPMNVSLPGRLMNQDLDQLHTSKRSDKNEELESVVFSQSGTLAMPSAHCDYSQAGLDIVANFEPEARQSNLRAPVRPSKLRNSVSSMSPDSAQPLYQSGQARPQNKRTIFEATAFDQGTAIRGRRHTDADLFPYSYHIPETNPYLADQDLTNNGAADLSNFAYPSRYPSPHSYSHPYGAQSPYIHRGVHEDLAHEKVSSHRRRDDLLFQQPAAHLSNTSPSQPSSFAQPHFTIMKQEDSSPESGAQSMVYQPLGSNSTATEIDTYRSNRAADAAPRYNEQDKPFFEQIFAAMMDTSKAVDSKAIIGTWKNASADREAVAGVARDLVRLCRYRAQIGRPFGIKAKPGDQFDHFEERFEALCKALTERKTMCKHLLRPPYIEGIIDDPKGSVARIENNKKVNYGKKKAIEAGRKAMSHSIQAQRSTRNFVDDEDDLDADYDSDQAGHSQDHTGVMLNPNQSHEDFSRMNRTNSLEVQDQSYREGSVPKRAKKPSRSIYQMNEHGQMIDTSMPPSANSRSLQPSYGSSLILNSQFPHPLGTTQSMAHHPADSPWTSNANINTYSHGSINPAGNEQQQVSRQRPRRNTRR